MMIKDAVKKQVKRYDITLADAVVTKDAGGECIIAGYANTSTKDRVGDVVDPKAFEKSLPVYLKNPILLANHDWEDPIGTVLEAKIDEKGLWIRARISDTREDIKTLIREKCLRTFSIGYNELDADYDESTKTKYVKDLELLEISVVTVPANHEAMFDLAESKSFCLDMIKFVEEVQTVLDRKMEGSEVGAACAYFIENKGESMKTKELIELLSKKSAAAPVATDAAKADAPAAAPAEGQPEGESQGAGEMAAKLDAMAQALAKILTVLEGMGKGESSEEKPSEEKPADEAKAPEDKPKDEEEEMSDEDCEKALAELETEIAALEDET